jgi:hypothetical protein
MMAVVSNHDDQLLDAFARGDAEAFVAFYRRHLAAMLEFFLRRTGDPELTADLTAEVFAAALIAARRYRPGERPALAWLYGIAAHKLTDSRRRGRVEARARKRLALEPLVIGQGHRNPFSSCDGGRPSPTPFSLNLRATRICFGPLDSRTGEPSACRTVKLVVSRYRPGLKSVGTRADIVELLFPGGSNFPHAANAIPVGLGRQSASLRCSKP